MLAAPMAPGGRPAAGRLLDYYLRGWKLERIRPDFVTMAGPAVNRPNVLVFETKDKHLTTNRDNEYEKRVFAALEETFNAGRMIIRDGPAESLFRLVFDDEGFPEAAAALAWLDEVYRV